ncbi:hypothetical protein BDV18DRAFT_141397 [Aspergillus unguis]
MHVPFIQQQNLWSTARLFNRADVIYTSSLNLTVAMIDPKTHRLSILNQTWSSGASRTTSTPYGVQSRSTCYNLEIGVAILTPQLLFQNRLATRCRRSLKQGCASRNRRTADDSSQGSPRENWPDPVVGTSASSLSRSDPDRIADLTRVLLVSNVLITNQRTGNAGRLTVPCKRPIPSFWPRPSQVTARIRRRRLARSGTRLHGISCSS